MNKDSKKTIMIISLISIFLCGCPGCFLFIQGVNAFTDNIGTIQTLEDVFRDLGEGFALGGWTVCASVLLIMVPIVLLIIAVVMRSKKGELTFLEPTGISKDDPLPPPS